jgi:hypothetical protein
VIVHWAEDGEVNQQSIYPVIVHWAEDGEVNQQSIYPVIVHWAEDGEGLVDLAILCPVYYHWVYTLLVDLAQRYPLPSVL